MLKLIKWMEIGFLVWGFISWLDIIALDKINYSWNLFEIICKFF